MLLDYDGSFCINCGWRPSDAHTAVSFDELTQTVQAMRNIRYPVRMPLSTEK